MVVVAACSSSDDTSAPATALALADETATATAERSTTTRVEVPEVTEPAMTELDTTLVDDVDTAASPGGSGAPAPPTAGGAPSDLMAAYTGALGTYGIDDLLYGRPVDLPTVPAGVAPLTGLPSPRSATSATAVKTATSS